MEIIASQKVEKFVSLRWETQADTRFMVTNVAASVAGGITN
jgi:hypothetical protein